MSNWDSKIYSQHQIRCLSVTNSDRRRSSITQTSTLYIFLLTNTFTCIFLKLESFFAAVSGNNLSSSMPPTSNTVSAPSAVTATEQLRVTIPAMEGADQATLNRRVEQCVQRLADEGKLTERTQVVIVLEKGPINEKLSRNDDIQIMQHQTQNQHQQQHPQPSQPQQQQQQSQPPPPQQQQHIQQQQQQQQEQEEQHQLQQQQLKAQLQQSVVFTSASQQEQQQVEQLDQQHHQPQQLQQHQQLHHQQQQQHHQQHQQLLLQQQQQHQEHQQQQSQQQQTNVNQQTQVHVQPQQQQQMAASEQRLLPVISRGNPLPSISGNHPLSFLS